MFNPSITHAHNSTAPKDLIDYYKAIEGASRQMLEAAQLEDWDQVVRLEGACAVLIEQLRAESRKQDLPVSAKAEKQRIMLSILRHDAIIRQLAEPWLADIDTMLGGQQPRQLH
ncbi:MAG TPA: flagellar protein FliT [Burkholderiaceae bacterium]|nr:flagellar protein FliT [Burkholderiaceae bacterium]